MNELKSQQTYKPSLHRALSNLKLKLIQFRKTKIDPMGRSLSHNNSRLYKLPEFSQNDRTAIKLGFSITAIVKNEANYLIEWIEFHRLVGVNHFFIYDNGSEDETEKIIEHYANMGVATYIPWRNFSEILNAQTSAYGHALTNFGREYRWMAFIDVDEFMFPLKERTLSEEMINFSDLPSLSIPWFNFGPSGHETTPKGLVIENYTERAAFPPKPDQYSLLRYKTIVDPSRVTHAGSHTFPVEPHGTVMFNENKIMQYTTADKDIGFACSTFLRLNHYFSKSFEDIERKIKKGRVSRNGKVVTSVLNRRMKQYNRHIETDHSIQCYVEPVKTAVYATEHKIFGKVKGL